jgi:hypothetical protein
MQTFADYPDTLNPEEGESLPETLDHLLTKHLALHPLKMKLCSV